MTTPLVLMTRTAPQSDSFVQAFKAQTGCDPAVLISPLLSVQLLPLEMPGGPVQALLFTSSNGVRAFVAQSSFRDAIAICVGPNTAALARSHGFTVDQAKGTAADVLERAQNTCDPQGGLVLHLSGQDTTLDIAKHLKSSNFNAQRIVLYKQSSETLSAVARSCLAKGPTIVPLFSPKTAQTFAAQCKGLNIGETHLLCISENTAQAVASFQSLPNVQISTVQAPNRAAMIAALANLL